MNIQQLRERYAAPEIPKCRVCGGVLTVQLAGGGPTIWGCTGMIDDPTGERNWIYAEGRSCADEHYERSRWSDYRQGGDADVIELIDALEAAERERDELRAEQAEHDEQIARMESKFSLAKRALDSKTARCEKAEAELRRRDAAAGEAVHFYREHNPSNGMKTDWIEVDSEQLAMLRESTDPNTAEFRSLYTDAPPAVLPPERLSLNNGVVGFNEGYNECLADARALGAQQQKVVELPTTFTVIGENIRSQNNRCTADPIFCVFEKVPTPAAEGYNHTRIEWYDSDHDRDATPVQAARLEALFDGGRCDDNDYKCWRRLAMHDVDTFVTACFTFKGCEDYLAQNGHNLRQPFVYVTSAYRNDEYKAVREWLMQLAAAPAPGGDDA